MNSTSNSTSNSCIQTDNPDISGIGVRLSFYLQCFLLVILVDRSWQDAPSALWTFIASNFGLTVAAIAQARQRQLSFYQALQVTNLVWLANFGTFIALASYSRHRTHEKEAQAQREDTQPQSDKPRHQWSGSKVKLAAMVQTYFSMALTIATWAKPEMFINAVDDSGETCEAPQVTYVVMFGHSVSVSAGSNKRVWGIAFSSLFIVIYSLVTLYELFSYVQRKALRGPNHDVELGQGREIQVDGAEANENTKMMGDTDDSRISLDLLRPPTESHGHPLRGEISSSSSSASQRASPGIADQSPSAQLYPSQTSDGFRSPTPIGEDRGHRPKAHRSCGNVDPMFFGVAILELIIWAYFVTVTELLLKRNPHSAVNSQWGFGQILALVLIVPSLISVIEAFKEHKFKQLHHRLAKKNERRRRGHPKPRAIGGSSPHVAPAYMEHSVLR